MTITIGIPYAMPISIPISLLFAFADRHDVDTSEISTHHSPVFTNFADVGTSVPCFVVIL